MIARVSDAWADPQEEFLAQLCADEDLLRAEFDASRAGELGPGHAAETDPAEPALRMVATATAVADDVGRIDPSPVRADGRSRRAPGAVAGPRDHCP
ncbi:hypothetical protein [Amycolatopsis panacis]|uniref:Uncharacterized protein n=1 Tax=Amycolatopsis panacis TaxID=2340917 RepID=A0A419I4R3_9PSEU|nr:hypothetical protein [Amycolatopsis panacis]RJQ85489.1 hypothetical protein D5S19_13995 [Amycolatopsis panacis]